MACEDDNSSSTTTCGANEVPSGNACVCDPNTHYYGTPGNCELCTGDHKIVKDNACVCDTNYEDNGAGGCKEKNSTLTCGEHEVENAGSCVCNNSIKYYGTAGSCTLCEGTGKIVKDNECVCDNANNYYGTAGSCTLCEGTGKIVKDNECVCDDTNYEDNGAGGCKEKNSTLTCGQHEVESGGSCVCDNANKYYGTTGSCTLCEDSRKIVKDNECICDADSNYADDGKGGCKVQCGSHEIATSKDACICDNANNYYGEQGSCTLCSGEHKIIKDNQCVCDASKGWTANDSGACACDVEKGYIADSTGKNCICDESKGLKTASDGSCECKDYKKILYNGACVCNGDLNFISHNPDGFDRRDKDVCVCDGDTLYFDGSGTTCELCNGSNDIKFGSIVYNRLDVAYDLAYPYCVHKVGDTVMYGHYDRDVADQNPPKPIEWIVLDIDRTNKMMLLLSKYIIEYKQYGTQADMLKYEGFKYKYATLCKDMSMLTSKFTNEEQIILDRDPREHMTDEEDGPNYNVCRYMNTTGPFPLSLSEYEKYKSIIEKTDSFKGTPYVASLCKEDSCTVYEDGYCNVRSWWLRNIVSDSGGRALYVYSAGYGNIQTGRSYLDTKRGVRPAVWVSYDPKRN